MHYGKKTPSTYRSTPSVYSNVTGRTSNMGRTRSMKSVKIPWYQKPLITNNKYFEVQHGAMLVGVFALLVAIFTIVTGCFDIYCLAMAAPGSTHYGYYIISYEFVYVGNVHVRNALIIGALFSVILAIVVVGTSILMMIALRKLKTAERKLKRIKEYEKKVLPFLWTFAIFVVFRLFAFLFFSIVNDLIFAYNILMVLCWSVIVVVSVYGWFVVYSLYLELSDLTKLEDLAHLRMGTMASLHASTAHSLAGSRPTTPHSTVSTMPVDTQI